jgi:hypothetical protein
MFRFDSGDDLDTDVNRPLRLDIAPDFVLLPFEAIGSYVILFFSPLEVLE